MLKLLLSWREVERLQDPGLHAVHERYGVGDDVIPTLTIPGRFAALLAISQIGVAPKKDVTKLTSINKKDHPGFHFLFSHVR